MTVARTGVQQTNLPGLIQRGKVRDLYDLQSHLMIVATDRISAFDVVMDQPIPGKGALLTRMSRFWLERLPACTPHHLEYVVSDRRVPPGYEPHVAQLRDRAMVVKRVDILPIECIVRGYLVGSGWKEYQAAGGVSGVKLPAGLRCAEKLPEPIFTPSTKAVVGHDELVSFEQSIETAAAFLARRSDRGNHVEHADPTLPAEGVERGIGHAGPTPADEARALMEQVRRRSLDIYLQAAQYAESRGIIIADTKFEFGLIRPTSGSEEPLRTRSASERPVGTPSTGERSVRPASGSERLSFARDLLLADEVLTPDSSRFWPLESYRVGSNPPSFDKQYLRDYLETLSWAKQPPPPPLPAEVIESTRQKYAEAYRLLAG